MRGFWIHLRWNFLEDFLYESPEEFLNECIGEIHRDTPEDISGRIFGKKAVINELFMNFLFFCVFRLSWKVSGRFFRESLQWTQDKTLGNSWWNHEVNYKRKISEGSSRNSGIIFWGTIGWILWEAPCRNLVGTIYRNPHKISWGNHRKKSSKDPCINFCSVLELFLNIFLSRFL